MRSLDALANAAEETRWSLDQLDWTTPVDLSRPWMPAALFPLHGSPLLAHLSASQIEHLRHEVCCWVISQLFHGELDALLAAMEMQALETADGARFLDTQIRDEARHVAVFWRYLDRKVGGVYPRCHELERLRVLTQQAESLDMKVLATQVVLEGLGLATLGTIHHFATGEPLLRKIVQLVVRDEARHVTYGVVSLAPNVTELSEAERGHREDFVCELVRLMRDRLLCEQVWERAGLPVRECTEAVRSSPGQVGHRRLMFAKIVTTLDRIGLLGMRMRHRLDQLGALRPPRQELLAHA